MNAELVEKLKSSLVGSQATDFRIGYSTAILLTAGNDVWSINLGDSEIVHQGLKKLIHSEDIKSKFALVDIFQLTLSDIEIAADGGLSLVFKNGLQSTLIITRASESYEAWEINGPYNFQVVCTPGGKISSWG